VAIPSWIKDSPLEKKEKEELKTQPKPIPKEITKTTSQEDPKIVKEDTRPSVKEALKAFETKI
jgi:hypothetical protein